MIRFVVGGAVDKQKVANKIREVGGNNVTVEIKSDIEAAMVLKMGKADYYLGACTTGGGGALAMAMALLGAPKCATVSMPGRPPKEADVINLLNEGRVAFGFTNDHIDQAVAYIVGAVLQRK